MNIDYKLLEEQRNHLLSILWHDDKGEGVHGLLDEEMGWGIIHLLDHLLDEKLKKDLDKDPVFQEFSNTKKTYGSSS